MTLAITLLDKDVAELATTLAPADLLGLQEVIAGADTALKRRKATFEALLTRLFADKARAEYTAQGTDTGTVHIPASNTLDLTIEVDKTVVYDQEKLRATLDAMPAADAKHYAKVTLEIPEAKYKNAPPDTQAKFKEARTVKPGRMKFTLKERTINEAA